MAGGPYQWPPTDLYISVQLLMSEHFYQPPLFVDVLAHMEPLGPDLAADWEDPGVYWLDALWQHQSGSNLFNLTINGGTYGASFNTVEWLNINLKPTEPPDTGFLFAFTLPPQIKISARVTL